MTLCPEGHTSASTDYCDTCGSTMSAGATGTATPPEGVAQCPACGALIDGRFCEDCGHDSALPVPQHAPAPTVVNPDATLVNAGSSAPVEMWIATVTADAAHYHRMIAQKGPDADRVDFPDYYPARRIPLHGTDILIGKHSTSQGLHPDIDLAIAPADIAVSRSHAILHLNGGSLTVMDLGSTNGTCLNGSDTPIAAKQPIPLQPGDRIHVGGWTTITISKETT
ncbi:FHA domain-containing protein [Nocardia sp. NBC_01503]|uniref:FHA domain-containing protein n=1 Tax=Nocardia sp. NBC_01503 TaxID=2975997 RepID=UPI002E7C1E33|nr:FHA domain-containing protein [Nocardia sp. NBC_01503]WTL32027.1 FHA domain-containing protein [Nocardia sp. NBC_01503]